MSDDHADIHTGPSPADLEAVQDQLDELRQDAARQATLLDALAGAIVAERAGVAESLTALEDSITVLLGRETDPAPTKHAKGWSEDATDQDWDELADWVDWVVATYDLRTSQQIKPCWAAHLGVVEELAALCSAWNQAALKARKKDPEALAFWHDRYLAPVLTRLNTIYSIHACSNQRHEPPSKARPTDLTLIDVRSADGKRLARTQTAP